MNHRSTHPNPRPKQKIPSSPVKLRSREFPNFRVFGQKPTLTDLHTVVFSSNNTFGVNETVLVPRSRGGFTYARIQQPINSNHSFDEWRLVYPNARNEHLFKDLPAAFIGKLLQSESEYYQRETRSDSSEIEQDSEIIRTPGTIPVSRDLLNAVFSTHNVFLRGEIVIISRSSGGFTYGIIDSDIKRTPESIKHKQTAFRVLIRDHPERLGKVVMAGNIGKLFHANPHLTSKESESEFPSTIGFPSVPRNGSDFSENQLNFKSATKNQNYEFHEVAEEFQDLNINGRAQSENFSPTSLSPIAPEVSPELNLEGVSNGKRGVLNVNLNEVQTSSKNPVSHEDHEYDRAENGNYPDNIDSKHPRPHPHHHYNQHPHPPSQNFKKAFQHSHHQKSSQKHNGFHSQNIKRKTNNPQNQRLVIIDGPNVARKHGKKKNISVRGIELALEYWEDRGYSAIAFLPEHFMTRKAVHQSPVKLQEFLPMADNIPLLQQLVDEGRVILTPPQDYDDSYMIEYAKLNEALLVTNDRYWDHIDSQPEEKKRSTTKWIREHCISFTFVRDDFLPNPDFVFPPEHT